MVRRTFLSAVLFVSGCSAPSPEPAPPVRVTPPPAPAVRPAPAPPLAANWEDRTATAGDWAYRSDDRGSIALFGTPGADALLTVRCALPARTVYLSRAGQREADDALVAMTLRTTTGVKSFPAAETGGTPPYLAISIQPRDPHLDAMAFSRGKFLVSVKGQSDLIVPSWAEVTRVIEDCRA